MAAGKNCTDYISKCRIFASHDLLLLFSYTERIENVVPSWHMLGINQNVNAFFGSPLMNVPGMVNFDLQFKC